MLDVKKYVYDALVAGMPGGTKIQYMYPNSFTALPVITYQETNQRNAQFYDNLAWADESTIQIDIWANVSTSTLAKQVDAIMAALLFTRDFSSDVPEPDAKIFHRVMRYRRTLSADDIDSL